MGNTELNLFRPKRNLNSSTSGAIPPHVVQKLWKGFPNFLCLGIADCSKYHHHGRCSLTALCRFAKRHKRRSFFSLSFLPHFFTLPARTTPLPPITPQNGAPSSCNILQLNQMPSSREGSLNPSQEKPQSEVLYSPQQHPAADQQTRANYHLGVADPSDSLHSTA